MADSYLEADDRDLLERAWDQIRLNLFGPPEDPLTGPEDPLTGSVMLEPIQTEAPDALTAPDFTFTPAGDVSALLDSIAAFDPLGAALAILSVAGPGTIKRPPVSPLVKQAQKRIVEGVTAPTKKVVDDDAVKITFSSAAKKGK